MRKGPTIGEALLWTAIRRRNIQGWKFRRQAVIGGYIVDFHCPQLRLVLEVDGSVHEGRHVEDEQRDADLAALGIHVHRICDTDVREQLDEVLRVIATLCTTLAEALPSLAPRGKGRGWGQKGNGRGWMRESAW